MTLHALELSIILTLMLIALIKEWFPAEMTVLLALTALILTGSLTPDEALSGFSNTSVHTVASLFIVGAAVKDSELIHGLIYRLLKTSKSITSTLFRMMMVTSSFSALINNTPLVVILLPAVQEWAFSNHTRPSKLLIPLSYAAILGGTITLIGTSTNLLIHGLLVEKGLEGFHFLDFAFFGLPLAVAGILYCSIFGHFLLPNREMVKNEPSLLNQTYKIIEPVTGEGRAHAKKIGFKKAITLSVLILMIGLGSFQVLSLYKLSLGAAAVLVLTRTLKSADLIKSINWNVLTLMAGSIGIGKAVESSGLAVFFSTALLLLKDHLGVVGIIVLFYFLTSALTEVLNNLAAAALMFPIGFALAEALFLDPYMFAMLTAIAASCSFLTPIGYQTNMIVYGAGGYKFTDFIKIGLPLSLICMTLTLFITYLIWL